jgi:methylmalonyl-CoA mutase cobalamin-binding subunit
MALSQSLLATLLLGATALQRPARPTIKTRLHATTASSKDADVVVVTHAAGRMGASLCAQLHEALTQREK